MFPPLLLLLPLLGISMAAVRAAETTAPTEAELRAAITKSFDFLAKEGDAWMNERNCNACHHLPQLIWSHREAKRRGFAIDQKMLDEYVEWSAERATDPKSGPEMAAFLKLAR